MPVKLASQNLFRRREAIERSVLQLLDLAQRKGGNLARILARAGVRQSYGEYQNRGIAEANIDELQIVSACASVEISNLQGTLVGREEFRNTDWRLLFYCLVGSRNLREAIERTAELFSSVDGRLGCLSLTEKGGFARIDIRGERGPDPELALFVSLQGYTMYHAIYQWLIGCDIKAAATLEFPKTAYPDVDEDSLPLRLVFDDPEPALVFSAAYLDCPIIRSIGDCEGVPTFNLLFGAGRRSEAQEIAERARQTLYVTLRNEHQLPSLDRLAATLGVPRMTLRRRLTAAGTSFNRIREECRKQLGLELLRKSTLSIEQIAEQLGYCDSDALRTAVRSWVAMSPTAYRRHLTENRGDSQSAENQDVH